MVREQILEINDKFDYLLMMLLKGNMIHYREEKKNFEMKGKEDEAGEGRSDAERKELQGKELHDEFHKFTQKAFELSG